MHILAFVGKHMSRNTSVLKCLRLPNLCSPAAANSSAQLPQHLWPSSRLAKSGARVVAQLPPLNRRRPLTYRPQTAHLPRTRRPPIAKRICATFAEIPRGVPNWPATTPKFPASSYCPRTAQQLRSYVPQIPSVSAAHRCRARCRALEFYCQASGNDHNCGDSGDRLQMFGNYCECLLTVAVL